MLLMHRRVDMADLVQDVVSLVAVSSFIVVAATWIGAL